MTKHPDLEVISSERPFEERRKLPRLSLSGEQFRLEGTCVNSGKIFAVSDLSRQGMAIRLLDLADLASFRIATLVEGHLNLRRQKYPLKAMVRNVRRELVGLEFEELEKHTETALRSFLDPEVLGRELKPIPSEGQSTLWYHGPSGTDLLLWRGWDGQYSKMTLYVQRNFIQWDAGKLSTGIARAAEGLAETRGIVRFETMSLLPDTEPDPGKLDIAKTLLLSSTLPEDVKKWCVRQLAPRPSTPERPANGS